MTFRSIVRAGEVLGIYGLVGAGRTEFAETVFGVEPPTAGSVHVDGRPTRVRRPADAIRSQIAFVPDDRLRKGIFGGLSVRENIVLSQRDGLARGVWISNSREDEVARHQIDELGIHLRSVDQPLAELSGGNQQKVVLARWLARDPAVLILDEPTRGIDVRAKAEIHRLIRSRADAGCGIVLISSELSEVMSHADRIVVFREGRIAGEFPAGSEAHEIAAAAVPVEAHASQVTPGERKRIGRSSVNELGLAVAIVALAAILAWTVPAFRTAENLLGVMSGASVWILLSLAAATVIVAGAIDISIGSLLALSAATAGLVLGGINSPALAFSIAIGLGLAVGALGGMTNAALALAGGIHPIVVTLGTLTIYRGLLITLTSGEAITDLPRPFLALAGPFIGGVEGSVIISLACTVAVHVLWTYHRAGRQLFAYGSNPAARADDWCASWPDLVDGVCDRGPAGRRCGNSGTCPQRLHAIGIGHRLRTSGDRGGGDWRYVDHGWSWQCGRRRDGCHLAGPVAQRAGAVARGAGSLRSGGGGVDRRGDRHRPRMARSQTMISWRSAIAWLIPLTLLFCAVSLVFSQLERPAAVLELWRPWAEIGALAAVMTAIVITGGIDLSVGSTIALSSVVLGVVWKEYGVPIGLAAGVAVLTGAIAGTVNAALVVWGIAPLVATLATMALFSGAAMALAGGERISGLPHSYNALGQSYVLGLPAQFWLMSAVFVVAYLFVHRTRWGRRLFAIGDNRTAARYAGIDVERATAALYVLSGPGGWHRGAGLYCPRRGGNSDSRQGLGTIGDRLRRRRRDTRHRRLRRHGANRDWRLCARQP